MLERWPAVVPAAFLEFTRDIVREPAIRVDDAIFADSFDG